MRAALLKDIGTVGISSRILDKPGALTAARVGGGARPCDGGRRAARRARRTGDRRAAADHHERLDGSGYPRGLRGDEVAPTAAARRRGRLRIAHRRAALPPSRPAAGGRRAAPRGGRQRLDAELLNALAEFVNE